MRDIVSLELALLAKEKGFYEDTTFGLSESGNIIHKCVVSANEGAYYKWDIKRDKELRLPSPSQLQQWLREDFDINIFILPTYDKGKCNYDSFKRIGYVYEITKGKCNHLVYTSFNVHLKSEYEEDVIEGYNELNESFEEFLERMDKPIFNTYEKALEEGLKQALKLIE